MSADGDRDPGGRGWFRAVVEADRAATTASVLALRSEIDDVVLASADGNADDEHDPEGATIAFERARAIALLATAEAHLSALDRAEVRLRAGTFATCDGCGGPIDPARLAARPATVTCIGCASAAPPR